MVIVELTAGRRDLSFHIYTPFLFFFLRIFVLLQCIEDLPSVIRGSFAYEGSVGSGGVPT